ncbi:MAG: UPF0164 family protein, partial [bacterium]
MKLLLVIGLIAFSSYGIDEKAGISGAQFLNIGVSARASGMGGAYCALSDDVDSICYNPAGLGKIEKKGIGFMHSRYLNEVNYEYLAGVMPLGNQGIGIALSLLNSSRIKRTTVSNPSGDGSSFDACDYSLTGSYGKN